MSEFNLEARWVKLSEREPNHDDEVFARKTAEDFLTVIYFAEDGDIKYSINGESYIFDDQMDQWEWLELRPRENVFTVGDYAYVSTMAIVDIEDRANPKVVGYTGPDGRPVDESIERILKEPIKETPLPDEWRAKEKPEPAVPLPDGIHEVTLPDGQSAFISDSGGYYGPAVPLPDGRTLGVHELSNLSEMFRLQHHLNSRIGADMVDVDAVGDKEAIARWTQKFVTAMQQELAELVDCVPWKWWRPDEAQPYDRQNARVEIVDLFHFLISLAQLHGMSAEDVYNTYRAKCQINHKRQDSGYLKKDPDDCRGI